MGDFVNQIRSKLGLEPKRDRTVTGKIPNEVKVNRLQNEAVRPGLNPVVFAPGRWNPPHMGHGEIVNRVIEEAKKHGAPHHIVLTRTHQPATERKNGADTPNPMHPDKKLHWARTFFPHANITLAHPERPSVLHQVSDLYSKGHRHLIVVAGSDQVDNYTETLNKYNGKDGAHGFYNFDKIDVIPAGEKRDPESKGVAGISSSKIKAAVARGTKGKLSRNVVPPHITDKEFKEYVGHVKEGITFQGKISEQNTPVIPTDDTIVGVPPPRKQGRKGRPGFDDIDLFNAEPNVRTQVNFNRRAAIKRARATGALEETIGPDLSGKPDGSFGTTNPVPTPTVKPKTKVEGVGFTDPVNQGGSPKYGGDGIMYEIKPPKRKSLKEYIISEDKKKDSKSSRSDSYGKLTELLFAKHLNDGKHCDHYRAQGKTPKEMHDHHARSLFGEEYSKHPEYKRLNEAAKKAADEHREYLKKVHGIKHITRVVWTSQKGDHEKETGVDDPATKADVIITGHDGKQVAASVKAKIPGSANKNTNWANHGLKTLSAHCGENIENNKTTKQLKAEHNKFVQTKLNPKNEKISNKELHERYKKYVEKNGEVNDITRSSGQISQHIAKIYAKGLKNKLKTDEDHITHIKRAVSAAGQKKGGDPEAGKTHLHQDVVAIHPSENGNHHTQILPFSDHVHGHLREYHDYQVEHAGNGVTITATHKKTGQRHTVYRTQIYAGGIPETTQQRTQTTLPQFRHYESSKKFLKEEVSLLEYVQTIISESKDRGADSKGYFRPTEQGAGLTRKGAKKFGVKTAVTTPPSKLDPKGKAAKRRKSFCARMSGMPGPMKDEKGRPTRKAMSLRRWNCEANEVLMSLVEAKKMKGDPCWKDYEMVGMKMKNGRKVPDCRGPIKESVEHPAVVKFASIQHENWRKGFDPTGQKERIKKNSDGTEGNINVPFEKLHPDWQRENLEAGKAALNAINLHGDDTEKAAEHVHNEWMKRNPKGDWNKDQHVAYSQLPENEKQKDRDHITTMRSLLNAGEK